MHPAAGTLGSLGLGDADGQARIVDACADLSAFLGLRPDAVGDDAHLGQIHALAGGADGGVLRRQGDVGFQRLADTLVGVRLDRKSTRLNSSHTDSSRMPSSA